MPITWHNINAPSMTGVSRGFAAAGDGINAGFDRLANTLSTYEAGAQALKERTDQGLVLDLKTALSNAKTPEQVQALQGQLQDITSRLTTNKGREGVLGAEDARMSAVQNQITAANAFKAGLRNDAQSTALAEINNPTALLNAAATAARAPIQKQLDDAALASRVQNQPLELQTSALTAASGLQAAKFKTAQTPAQELLATKTTKESLAQADDTERNRAADLFTENFVAKHQAKVDSARTAITDAAHKFGAGNVPFNADGSIALDQMDSAKREGFNSVLRLAKLPTLDVLEGGDTAAKTALVSELKQKGYSASTIARITSTIDFSLSTAATPVMGNDKSVLDRTLARREVLKAQIEGQYGVKAEPGGVGEQLKAGVEAIDSVISPGSPRAEIYKERLGHFLQNGGIKVTDPRTGEVSRVMPNPDQIRLLVSSIDKKWHNTRLGGMQSEIDDALNSWANSKEAQTGANQLITLDFLNGMEQARKAGESGQPIAPILGGKKK